MSLIYKYDGSTLTHKVEPSAINIGHRADMGEETSGGIPIEDPSATLTMVGHKPFTVDEDDCSQPRLFTGWTTERGIGRDLDRGMFVGANPRLHDTTIVDMQAAFGFRQITGADGNRPSETWQARCTWILQSDYLDDAISHSEDFIVTNTTAMDAADYRGSTPSAVMDDLSDRSGNAYTYFLFWNPATTAITLFFDNETESIALSTLSISNVYTDVDSATCFAPDSVAVLAREPDQTYSEVVVEYNDGTQKLFRKRASTEAAYIRRGTTIQRPYTKSLATATSQAEKWLDKHSVEVDRITCSIQVPSSAAGLVQAGQSMAVRFSHMPGYETGATMRVVSCSPKPTNDVADFYNIALELVGSQPAPELCPDPTPSATWYPLGGSGNTANPTPTGNVYYYRAGDAVPFDVTPGWVGQWHFPNWGAGGAGTVDYAGDQAGNAIQFRMIGPGTLTIHTATQAPPGRELSVYLFHWNGGVWLLDDTQGGNAGDTFAVAVPAETDTCDYKVEITDDTGGATTDWGFTGADWVAGPGADDVIDLGPTPGATTTHTVDPTVDDDETLGYGTPGMHWINTTTGHEFVLIDGTDGAAVWVSTTAISVFNFSTSDGTTTVDPTTELTFVGATLADLGGGVAELTVAVPTIALDDVTDVTITAVATDDVLTYDGAGWVNAPPTPLGVGAILISDTPSTPLVFADLIQNEAEDDLVYADI